MISKDFLPSKNLRDHISQYRLRHFIFTDGRTPGYKPFPPRPEQSLTFYIRGNETVYYLSSGTSYTKPRSVISGQFTSRVNRYVSIPEILMVIVDFKPGALYNLTGIPFREFTDKDIDAELVFGTELKNVNNRLNSTEGYDEIIFLIEQFCQTLLQSARKDLIAVDYILKSNLPAADCSVDFIIKNSFLSARQLERKFHERAGVSPKTFLRINQFNHSYWMHIKQPEISWSDISIHCGYTDYQHMVKAYKEFAFATPNVLFEDEKKAPGRVLFPSSIS